MTSFEHLYQGLFPQVAQDRIGNYSHVRLLKSSSINNATQIDVARPILGPVTRRNGLDSCILKCIPILDDCSKTHHRILREVAIHRALTLGSNSAEDRILPLLSHFLSRVIFSADGEPSKSQLHLILVLPYCARGSLAEYFSHRLASNSPLSTAGGNRGTLDESELRWTISELAKSLERCHERGIVHRDVKAENILLCQKSHLRISPANPHQEKGSLRLLLCDFGLSTWVDELDDLKDDTDEDSTFCGTWDYISPETMTKRRTGPAADVWALGCLCVFLLTGSLPFSSTEDDKESKSSSLSNIRVEAQSLYKRVEKVSIGDWEAVRAKLPLNLTYDCRNILEGMLQVAEKKRLSTKEILSHPFMKSTLPKSSLGSSTTEEIKAKAIVSKPRSGRVIYDQPRVNSIASADIVLDKNNSSSATLKSVMQRMSPAAFHAAAELSSLDQRKTPFGMVRIHKSKNKQEQIHHVFNIKSKLSWGDGYGTKGLVSVRQRIKGGKVQVTKDGKVVITTEQGSLTVSSDGIPLIKSSWEESSKDAALMEELYIKASKWLSRHRQRCTLAGFMLPAVESFHGQNLKGAVEYIAYCSVKGNGPVPDYQLRFAALEETTGKSVSEWNVQIEVQVQQSQRQLKMLVKIDNSGKDNEASWKECTLNIEGTPSGQDRTTWKLAGDSHTSIIVEDLSKREKKAIDRSLQASQSVDQIFTALIGE